MSTRNRHRSFLGLFVGHASNSDRRHKRCASSLPGRLAPGPQWWPRALFMSWTPDGRRNPVPRSWSPPHPSRRARLARCFSADLAHAHVALSGGREHVAHPFQLAESGQWGVACAVCGAAGLGTVPALPSPCHGRPASLSRGSRALGTLARGRYQVNKPSSSALGRPMSLRSPALVLLARMVLDHLAFLAARCRVA